eukprot:TRINITY_DN9960_c0_g1_i7.p1 TRINITY_DN9960_c0_g1~~TRINITY_DN9960_c0_g1_i7.p1  ORF type:complete len:950 (-),score=279.11 TRINITY_DN9960_c0_g1_i7:259-3108(-)
MMKTTSATLQIAPATVPLTTVSVPKPIVAAKSFKYVNKAKHNTGVFFARKLAGGLSANRQSIVRVHAVAAPEATKQRVYIFGPGKSQGNASMKELLGGKGANLAEMCAIGLSVPPGFTITTETCAEYNLNGGKLPGGCWDEVLQGIHQIESSMGKKFGDSKNPLLVSVRSGAAISMPGMMDTVLNLGLNDEAVKGLGGLAGERFAYDSYRRFLDMFGGVVMGVPHVLFESKLEAMKKAKGAINDTDLSGDDLKQLCEEYKQVYEQQGTSFPQDPLQQLQLGIDAVFQSWESERAHVYRSVNKITGLLGTAVNVQAMAFGNLGNTSGTGVCFTRDPSTGERKLYGEYLVNAQGEDVVAGIRTPEDILVMAKDLPDAHDQLVQNCALLEKHYKDMQDIEFTVQEGQLYMLQCRSGKRTGAAAVKIAVDLVHEGEVDITTAVTMVEPGHIDQLLHPQFEDVSLYAADVIGNGLPASPGAAVGRACFSAEHAEELKAQGQPSILVRKETSPEDVKGMYTAEGVVTQLGGMTSHAAVVARGWGKPCITGCGDLQVDEENREARINGHVIREGAWMSMNGSTGEVINGKQATKLPELGGDLGEFMSWVDQFRKLGVLTNADTPEDAVAARKNGAEGIGLTRTEHMFFKTPERIRAVRKMIMAQNTQQRKESLQPILEFQRTDFEGIFEAMDGFPVTIRLLDPPLHEFLPDGDNIVEQLAAETGQPLQIVEETVERLEEINPMLGFRGCRLAITYPEIPETQVRAIMEAACNVAKKGTKVQPDIMIPLIGTKAELEHQVKIVRATADKVNQEYNMNLAYRVGTMIEVPRAALLADEIAELAEFFSFGTNDLTQMTFGYSRDDIGKFLGNYLDQKILKEDPFQVLDVEGVGKLIEMATKLGRGARPNLKVGICGEQGGEPKSVDFCHSVGLDYVSCSPFRVPIARLAAAQAAIKASK